jgi:hypothetical protein
MSDQVLRALIRKIDDLNARLRALEGSEYTATAGDVVGSITQSTAIAARATRSTAQTIPHNTTTILDFDTVEYDIGNCVTTGASWKYTVEIAGVYRVSGGFTLNTGGGFADNELLASNVYVNDVQLACLAYLRNIPSGAGFAGCYGNTEVYCAIGDEINMRAFQASGASRDTVDSGPLSWITI